MFSAVMLVAALAVIMPAEDTVKEESTGTVFTKTLGTDPQLSLLGVAPRTKWFFKVYGVGLYADPVAIKAALGDGEANEVRLAAAVLASSGHRAIVLKFVRDLEKAKLFEAFKEGIEKTMPMDDPRIAADAKTILGAFTDVKNGEEATLYFNGSQISLVGRGTTLATVDNRSLARALLAIYVGSDPIDPEIKKNLLKFKI